MKTGTVFDTAIGPVGLAWGDEGIVAVQLPEESRAATETTLVRRLGDVELVPDPPPEIQTTVERITRLLDGAPDDLADVAVDLTGVRAFHERVYECIRSIPPGDTWTYGEVADRLGDPGAAQAVGGAMAANPVPIIVPCHRVLASTGLGGFSAPGGVDTKRRMLVIEGAVPEPPPTLFDDLVP